MQRTSRRNYIRTVGVSRCRREPTVPLCLLGFALSSDYTDFYPCARNCSITILRHGWNRHFGQKPSVAGANGKFIPGRSLSIFYFLPRRHLHTALTPRAVSVTAEGSGTGRLQPWKAIPVALPKPEANVLFVPSVAYSRTLPLSSSATNKLPAPSKAIPKGAATLEANLLRAPPGV